MNAIQKFLRLEALAGLSLVAAAIVGMIMANSPWAGFYDQLITTPFTVSLGDAGLSKPLLLWINDGLMAIFFLLVALELKREVLEGELSSFAQVALPLGAAVGGIVVPAGIYWLFNNDDPEAIRGWAIPAATDIAFALGVIAMLGNRVPTALKLFLLSLAVFDDIGAILIIAAFYAGEISWTAKGLALGALAVLAIMNMLRVTRLGLYFCIGILLWFFVLKSGMHATLAGVVLGLTIPLRATDSFGHSPLKHLEHMLHPWCAFIILPIFAFANAGVSLEGTSLRSLGEPVALGILCGLVGGKAIGVFGVAAAMIKMGWAKIPEGANLGSLLGVSVLSGIGFTMSLFIGTLAFEDSVAEHNVSVRIGVLGASLLAAILGFIILQRSLPSAPDESTVEQEPPEA
ncbi:MAG: Na+/H+ antiporter NhaA [Planctomycetota bacterium]|jgi:NhaA family Na+:H+ antiporter